MKSRSVTGKTISAVIAALVVAALGCYVLLVLKNPWGAALVLLSLCIAFPTTIRTGVAEFTHSAADLREAGFTVRPGLRNEDTPETRVIPAHVIKPDHSEDVEA